MSVKDGVKIQGRTQKNHFTSVHPLRVYFCVGYTSCGCGFDEWSGVNENLTARGHAILLRIVTYCAKKLLVGLSLHQRVGAISLCEAH